MTEFSEVPIDEITRSEPPRTKDAELEGRLSAIGVQLPRNEHFRGVFSSEEGFHAGNILGTPLYVYSDILGA